MTKNEAIKIRDDNKKKLVGQSFDKKEDWEIRDVIIASRKEAANVYSKMYDANIPNEVALQFYRIGETEFEVFVISHQWPWGSGNLLYEELNSYLKANSL